MIRWLLIEDEKKKVEKIIRYKIVDCSLNLKPQKLTVDSRRVGGRPTARRLGVRFAATGKPDGTVWVACQARFFIPLPSLARSLSLSNLFSS